jgi:hypothetical protein
LHILNKNYLLDEGSPFSKSPLEGTADTFFTSVEKIIPNKKSFFHPIHFDKTGHLSPIEGGSPTNSLIEGTSTYYSTNAFKNTLNRTFLRTNDSIFSGHKRKAHSVSFKKIFYNLNSSGVSGNNKRKTEIKKQMAKSKELFYA